MWSVSVLLRARSVSRNDVCKCFITCEECVKKWCGLQVFYYVRGGCQEMMWSVLTHSSHVKKHLQTTSFLDTLLARNKTLADHIIPWHRVLLRARSVSRNDVVCKCFITCEECVKTWCGLQVFVYVRGVCQEMMWSASVFSSHVIKHLQTTSFLDTLLARNKTLADHIISWHTPRT
jgi:hypothetical protein